MERCFIDFMLQKEHKMSRIGYNIDNQAWIDMVAVFKDRFGSKQDKDIFRSHYKRLEKQYLDMKDLLERGGFWWDESEQMITESDDVWDAYIEVQHLFLLEFFCYKIYCDLHTEPVGTPRS